MTATDEAAKGAAHQPAEAGVWVFLLADMCVFAMYFAVFAWDKRAHPEQFAHGQASLNTYLAAFNTIALLVSSYFMASAVHAARTGAKGTCARYLELTSLCGVAFLIAKTVEYTSKISAGAHIATNVFYRDYFCFTGLHMMHLVTGLGLLLYTLYALRSAAPEAQDERSDAPAGDLGVKVSFVDGVGLYWHMVDLLWVVLFTLIYLVP